MDETARSITPESGVEEDEEDFILKDVTVKFQISEAQIIAHAYPNIMTVEDIKEDISRKFRVSTDFLLLKENDRILPEDTKLCDIKSNDFGIVELDLILSEEAGYHNVNLDTNVYYSHFTLPDIITVHVADDGDERLSKDIVVEIENQSIIKPFLGGYVDRKNSKIKIGYSKIMYMGVFFRYRVSRCLHTNWTIF